MNSSFNQANFANLVRGRSHADSIFPTSSFEVPENLEQTPNKAKLYELFSLIEKEFDALYIENCSLRSRLDTNNAVALNREPCANSSDFISSILNNPTSFNESGCAVTGSGNISANVNDLADYKLYAKKHQTAKIWSADDTRCLFSYVGHSGSVNSIAIRSDSRSDLLTLLTTSGDRTAHIWRANLTTINSNALFEGGEDSPNFGGTEKSTNVINLPHQLSMDEKFEDEQIPMGQQLQQIAAPQTISQPLTRLVGHTDVVVAAEWLFGGEQLITASWDHQANVYDVESGKIVNTLSGHDEKLTHCSAHNSQRLVATASQDYTFRLWDFREPIQSVAVFQGHNDAVTSVVFTSMHHIISGSDDRTVKVWDLRNMRSPMSAIRLNSPANRLAVCNKYNLIAIPQDGHHISVYDLQGIRLTRLSRSNGKNHHLSVVCGASWLTDNPTNNLISCGFDKQIIGWRVQLPNK